MKLGQEIEETQINLNVLGTRAEVHVRFGRVTRLVTVTGRLMDADVSRDRGADTRAVLSDKERRTRNDTRTSKGCFRALEQSSIRGL